MSKKKGMTAKQYTPWLHPKADPEENDDVADSLPPCLYGVPVVNYMNRADVREALHIPDELGEWELCTTSADFHYIDSAKGS